LASKSKKAYAKREPEPHKQAYGEPPEVDDRRPVWRVQRVDLDGPFSWRKVDAGALERIVRRLGELETMTWQAIEGKRDHFLTPESLSKAARKRLDEIQQDDAADYIFSIHLGGLERVIGIRDRWILRILWWDPKHCVCPSTLKNT
jgi:hypothetical protein